MGVNPMDLIIQMRSSLIEEGDIPETIADALESMNRHGNPWGKPKNKRTEWMKGLARRDQGERLLQGGSSSTPLFRGVHALF